MFNMLKSEKLMRIVIREPQSKSLIFERIADDFFKPSLNNELHVESFDVDILTDESRFYLFADLPGCREENSKISYDHEYLTVEVQREENPEILIKGASFIRKERTTGRLIRRFFIESVDFEHEV